MKDATFAMQLIYTEQYVDENDNIQTRVRTLILDAVSEPQSTYSNTVTEHPIVSGDMVADHSYKNPMQLSFSGSAALKGHTGAIFDTQVITPSKLQEIFKQIKDNAYLCEIVKISVSNKDDIRFSRHSFMTLTSMTIVEKINTIDYTLGWQQVMLAKIQEADVDIDDKFLPNVTEPKTTSFTDALIDWAEVDKAVILQLLEYELLHKDFLTYIKSMTASRLTAIVAGVVVGVVAAKVAASLATVFGISAATGPVGWIVGAVVAGAIMVVGLVKAIAKVVKAKKYRIQQFKAYRNDKETDKEVERFCKFTGEIHTQLEQLNNVIHVYQISSDDDQECMVSISDNYYIFTFTTNNTTGKKMCSVTDTENSVRATIQDVSTSPSSYAACDTSNDLFRADENGAYVYIISPPVEGDFKLSNCFVVSSDINPEEYSKELAGYIQDALTY